MLKHPVAEEPLFHKPQQILLHARASICAIVLTEKLLCAALLGSRLQRQAVLLHWLHPSTFNCCSLTSESCSL